MNLNNLNTNERQELDLLLNELVWFPHPENRPQIMAYFTPAFETLYGGAAGGGKACYTGTMLPTPTGWTTMEEVQPGDFLLSDEGLPCKVVAISETFYDHVCYEVEFDDGEVIIADAGHRWLTFNLSERGAVRILSDEFRSRRKARRVLRGTGKRPDLSLRNSQREVVLKSPPIGSVRMTQEIFETLRVRDGRVNHSVPVCKPLDLPEAALLVPPYTLGAWLGDGKTVQGKIYCHKDDGAILDKIRRDDFEVTSIPSESIGWTIRGLQPHLRRIGVLGHKHIPMAYLRSSYEQRLELLRGLMDTDGTCDVDGGAEYTTILPELARNVLELARTLGIKATLTQGRATIKGKDCGPKYRVKMTTDIRIFNLARKFERQPKTVRQTQRHRYIVDCRLIKSVPMKCVEIDSPSHLYLTGQAMIPTHNSDLILGLARTMHHRSLLLRREFPELERSLISRSLEFFGDKSAYNASKHIWQVDRRRIEFGHMETIGTAQVPGDEVSYASAPYDFIGFDQLEQFPQYAYEFMFSRARSANPKQRVRVFCTANPVGENIQWIMQRWRAWLIDKNASAGELRYYKRDDQGQDTETTADDPDGVSRTFIPAGLKDNPYLGDDYRKTLNSLPNPLRSALLDGDWSASLTDNAYQVIPRAWVRAAMLRWTETPPESEASKPLVIGADIARGGDDRTVNAPRRGVWFDRLQKHSGRITPDGQSVVGLWSILLVSGGTVNVDVIGIGASAYDIARERGLSVRPINFSEKSDATDKSGTLTFVNMRAECYWRFREALDPASGNNIALPPDSELEGDLCSPRWIPQSNGIKIESKEDIKKRLGHSPDCADAVTLAWAVPLSALQLIAFA